MSTEQRGAVRLVQAVHGSRGRPKEPTYQAALAGELRQVYSRDALMELYGRFAVGQGFVDSLMRSSILRILSRHCGTELKVEGGVGFKHPETFEIGDGVFIGAQAYIQGRYDGTCIIGNNVWIGPMAYLDARNLVIEEFVGWGPGAKVLGSTHTAVPVDEPVIRTDLAIRPVHVCAWADIGTGATILPGVRIGKGAIIGAGAVVISDVEPFSVVAGVPARFVRWRTDADPVAGHEIGETS
jgi:galactoside O-acetyltransferase